MIALKLLLAELCVGGVEIVSFIAAYVEGVDTFDSGVALVTGVL